MLKYQPDIAVADPDPSFFTEISGLMNISACTAVGPSGHASESSGPDILMSFPHFCYVDPAVAQHTTGVSPCNHSRHDLWLGVEPTTGITMAARKRLQVRSICCLHDFALHALVSGAPMGLSAMVFYRMRVGTILLLSKKGATCPHAEAPLVPRGM